MLSKKLNDPLYWKNKLGELDSLPGDSAADKNALWERLNNRLQEKPRRSQAVWYWLAAGVMPLVIITLVMMNKAKNVLVEETAEKKVQQTEPAPVKRASQNETVIVSVPKFVEKKQFISIPGKKDKIEIFDDSVKTNEDVVGIISLPGEIVPGPTADINTPADSGFTTATTETVKKKLPVVHINELETFPAQFAAPANYTKTLANAKPGKRKTNNQTLVVAQPNTIGFRIKLSSKN